MQQKALIILLLLSIPAFCHAKSPREELGKVSKEELSMTSIPEDLEADAVILFDKGEYFFGYIYPVTFREHKRVKVFTKRGTEFANISIPFHHGEKIRDFEGYTFTKSGRKIRLESKQVFTKKGKDWDEIVCTLPGVEEGGVFEYRYEKWSDNIYFLGPWYFQNEIFTKLSQVSIKLQAGWLYSYRFSNPKEAKTKPKAEDGLTEKGYIWTLENVQAIREELHMACIDDYRTAIYFEKTFYKLAEGSQKRDTVDTWEEIGEMADSLYRSSVKDKHKTKVNEKALELTQNLATPTEKAVKVYDYVRQSIEWNEERGIFNFEDKFLETIGARLEGTAVEKNLLLWKLLGDAGIEAYPILLSTRDYGRIFKNSPGLAQFNHLIVYVKLEGGESLLDAVDRLCPFGMLPVDDLGGYGLLLDRGRSRLIQIPANKVCSIEYTATQGKLLEDGALVCSCVGSYQGYFNTNARKRVAKQGKEEFIKQEALHIIPTASIDSITCTALDSADQPFEISINLSAPHYAQVAGEAFYVNPTIFTRMESNPFQNESRSFPVDFDYPFTEIEDTEFLLPNGFGVKELPANTSREIPGVQFSKTFSVDGNLIKCRRQLAVTQLVFPVQQYQELRNLYQDIVSADQLLVALTREHK